jgi:hypothetical protein
MRFITEFEITVAEKKYAETNILHNRRSRLEGEMGNMVAESFGWQNPVLGDPLRYRLEIEAFPMEKWVEFKNRLLSFKKGHGDSIPLKSLFDLIKELETL